jgi:hypothetical protein
MVTDARFTFDDQRLDSKVLQSRRQFQARLATTNDDHDRLLVGPFALALPTPLFWPRSVLRFLLPQWTSELWESMQTFEIRENGVRLPIPIGHWDKAKDARSGSHRS